MADLGNTSRPWDPILKWWHVIVAVLMLTASAAASQTQINTVQAQVERMDTKGTTFGLTSEARASAELAKIEQRQIDEDAKIDHLVNQVDRLVEHGSH